MVLVSYQLLLLKWHPFAHALNLPTVVRADGVGPVARADGESPESAPDAVGQSGSCGLAVLTPAGRPRRVVGPACRGRSRTCSLAVRNYRKKGLKRSRRLPCFGITCATSPSSCRGSCGRARRGWTRRSCRRSRGCARGRPRTTPSACSGSPCSATAAGPRRTSSWSR